MPALTHPSKRPLFLLFCAATTAQICSCAPLSAPVRRPPTPEPVYSCPVPVVTPPPSPAAAAVASPEKPAAAVLRPLKQLGYTIQVGAFSSLDNAARFEKVLIAKGIDAYYFRHESGLYKVRFGDHADYRSARDEAEQLKVQGLIDAFFIVPPESYNCDRLVRGSSLRSDLVATARHFLGLPYQWGGAASEDGFDCSGLTMVCYRLNGLDLPRVSRSQFEAGTEVAREDLQPGDLVFFATRGGRRVSHVGMYIGDGRFIHAPRTGQTVTIEELSTPFYSKTFVGGRSYF